MKTRVGIIGCTGRMGTILTELLVANDTYALGPGFNRSIHAKMGLEEGLQAVFTENDIVIDFSSHHLVENILQTARNYPKPLIICTTGWPLGNPFPEPIASISKQVPIVIASNTSIGACLQRYLAGQVARILDASYDVDISEKHHRNKIDSPSGTAKILLRTIQRAKKTTHNVEYKPYDTPPQGIRPPHHIGMTAQRCGNLAGEHEVTFTGEYESLSIKHLAFDRRLFAIGALRIISWLRGTQLTPGIYGMFDVLGLTSV